MSGRAQSLRASASLTDHAALRDAEHWVSLSEDVEFLPFTLEAHNEDHESVARRAQKSFFSSQVDSSVDTFNTYYDAYSQAWRYLGFYIDCSNNNNNRDNHKRELGENQAYCRRYLIWAAVSGTMRYMGWSS
jgi:hypothetical protein